MKRVILPCVLAVLAARSIPAQGGTKEEIQRLQSDVLALQNQESLVADVAVFAAPAGPTENATVAGFAGNVWFFKRV